MKYYISAFKNLFNFSKEASLKDFSYFFLFNIIITVIFELIFNKYGFPSSFYSVYRAITFAVLLSVGFRRIKNTGHSPWLVFIPIVNLILAGMPEKEKQS